MKRPHRPILDTTLAAVLLSVLPLAPAVAGTTGQLSGMAMGEDGAPLPGVRVAAASPAQIGGAQRSQTNEQGRFLYPRLAPGIYVVCLELDGFVTRELTGVQVRLDRTTELQVVLPPAGFADALDVVETTPVVDPRQVSTGQVFTSEYLQRAALGMDDRHYIGLLLQTAGIASSYRPKGSSAEGLFGVKVLGSTLFENVYLVDGSDTTDPYDQLTGFPTLSFEAIDEVNFHTAGFEAEYGLATGGVVNLVTKSGGNFLSGTFDIRYRDSGLGERGDHLDPDVEPFETRDTNASVGGPIQRDRLWFFASAQRLEDTETPVGAPVSSQRSIDNYLGKLTWQPSSSWSLEARYLANPDRWDNGTASQFVAPEANAFLDWRTVNGHLGVTGVLTDSLVLDLRVGSQRADSSISSQDGDLSTIGHFNLATGETYGNTWSQSYDDRQRTAAGSDLSWFSEGPGGPHEVKGGVRYAETSYCANVCNMGSGRLCTAGDENYFFRDLVDESGAHVPAQMVVREAVGPRRFEGSVGSAYLQDAWRVRPGLTLKAGLRWDRARQENDVGRPVADLDMVQPRLGLAWDVGGAGRSVVRASWGRYMHPSSLHVARFAAERAGSPQYWYSCSLFFTNDPAACSALAGAFGWEYRSDPEGWDPAGWVAEPAGPGSLPNQIAPGLEPVHADELVVSFERELFRRTSLELSVVKKDTRDVFEDTCNGNLPDPMPGADCSHFVVANLPAARREYEGWLLRFESRALDRMHLVASYVYSDSRGSVEGDDTTASFDLFPFHFVNTYGYLSDHSRHRLKLNGYVHLPHEVSLGVSGRWNSEFRWSPTSANEPGMAWGVMYTEPRGSRSEGGSYSLDLQLTKGLRLGRARLDLIGTALNLFDSERATSVCIRVSGCGEFDLGEAIEWQTPRRYELGVRIEF